MQLQDLISSRGVFNNVRDFLGEDCELCLALASTEALVTVVQVTNIDNVKTLQMVMEIP